MMPESITQFPALPMFSSLGFSGPILPLVMKISFFAVLFFVALSALVGLLHINWYSNRLLGGVLSFAIYIALLVPLILLALSQMPVPLF